jgi:FGGY-family pentulose kinase
VSGGLVCAVDVGTGSARAGIFDGAGRLLGRGEHPIAMRRPAPGHAEHSSADIWNAVCLAVRGARDAAAASPGQIVSIAFDATCSLVIRDRDGRSLPVSPDADPRWDTIVWLDHRAIAEADECTATGHELLDLAGGAMSPEMQAPKLMWLKRNMPDTWRRAGQLFDLSDFLSFKATGNPARSRCTLACKWPYLAHAQQPWQHDFLDRIGLDDLLQRAALPPRAVPVGSDVGPLRPEAADELGLARECRVGAGMVDAYAGALALLGGLSVEGESRDLALIAGTSSCLMAITAGPRSFRGGWGPYHGVTLADRWVVEGGQSATGALLDHMVRTHAAGGEPTAELHARIAARIEELQERDGGAFAARLHVLPDFHGNRSPLADPHALGVVSGLGLDGSFDALCALYWRCCVAIVLGLRHILETVREDGHAVETVHLTGGHTRNTLFRRLYADAFECRVVEPVGEEAVLLGTAMAAAAAGGIHADLAAAALAMRAPVRQLPRSTPAAAASLDRDYAVYLEMLRHRRAIDEMTAAGVRTP